MRGTMNAPLLLCASLYLATFAAGPAGAQGRPAEGAEQLADPGDVQLQNGGVIEELRLGYRTLGTLNANRSNAIVWPTWLGGKSGDLLKFVGPGKVVDTTNYFVILVDALGNGISSSPSNSKKQPLMKFPKFGIRDMVESEHRLVLDVV